MGDPALEEKTSFVDVESQAICGKTVGGLPTCLWAMQTMPVFEIRIE